MRGDFNWSTVLVSIKILKYQYQFVTELISIYKKADLVTFILSLVLQEVTISILIIWYFLLPQKWGHTRFQVLANNHWQLISYGSFRLLYGWTWKSINILLIRSCFKNQIPNNKLQLKLFDYFFITINVIPGIFPFSEVWLRFFIPWWWLKFWWPFCVSPTFSWTNFWMSLSDGLAAITSRNNFVLLDCEGVKWVDHTPDVFFYSLSTFWSSPTVVVKLQTNNRPVQHAEDDKLIICTTPNHSFCWIW